MNITNLAENLGLDEEDIKELLELYVDATSSDLKELKAAVADADIQKAHSKAHSIKGASGNLGLFDFYELAKKIDDQARENRLDGLERLVRDFSGKFEKFVQEIQ